MRTNRTYRTSDLYVAAWLLSKGLELKDIDRSKGQRNDFIFVDRQDRPQLVQAFICGRAEGNLANFVFHFKRAKRILYSNEI